MLTHGSLSNRLHWWQRTQDLRDQEVFCQKTRLGFVDHVAEIFQALSSGMPLVILSELEVQSPPALNRVLERWPISRITLVPSLLHALLQNESLSAPSVCRIYSSGEALQAPAQVQFQRSFPNAQLWNIYGSTEVAADVTAAPVSLAEEGTVAEVSIGGPVDNTEIFILDDNARLTPPGALGEICVAGVALARGYLRRPAETASRFLPNPYSGVPGARLYRTGDMVRLDIDNSKNNLQLGFVGRRDQQIKIRGFRIEPGEIESVLKGHEFVESALVLICHNESRGHFLVAYIVINAGKQETQADIPDEHPLRQALTELVQQHLPSYMVPTAFVFLSALPLNANGKLNRKALPIPDLAAMHTEEYVPPQSDTELALVAIWSALLQVPESDIGTRDSFFQLGGHSLLAMKLVTQIKQVLGVTLALPEVFRLTTIAELAAVLESQKAAGENSPDAFERLFEGDEGLEEFDI